MNSKTRQPSTIEKIDLLNEQAWQQRVDNSNLAHQLSKEAIDMAEEIGYDKGKAQGYRTFAFTLIRLSRHHEALEYLNKAMPLFEILHDLDGQGSVNGYFGIIERSFGNYARSLDFLFKFSSLAKQTCNIESQALAYYHIGTTYKYLGDYEKALQYLLEGLSLGRTIHSGMSESMTLKLIGQIYFENEDYANAINYNLQSLELLKKSGDKWSEAGCLDNIGNIYCKLGDFQLGLTFCWQSLTLAQSIGDKKGEANSQFHLAEINKAQNEHAAALANAKQSLNIREAISDKKGQAEIYLFLGGMYVESLNKNETDDLQLQYLHKALLIGEETGAQDMLSKIHHRFYRVYRGLNQFEKALEHLETANAIEKEIHSKAFNQKILNLEISHKIEQSKKEAEIYRLRNVELADLYQQTNQQKEEIQTTLIELKETQSQLIQREKMASLGELTAGIAHEIQNPLNFVNNFSEINTELIDELQQDLKSGKIDDAIAISNDLKENEEKINHHGKRADAIVKGMLQHSMSSTGVKEPTDINKLADEYLRLAYHGLRAKDKSFNATLKTDFDENIGKINIIPQNIGRVLLNLYNNACYAVDEKKKTADKNYDPAVSVSTKKINDKVEIKVADNGNGIPQKIIDKIFQPFFTTKPTGQGTGLGLSLSYDIIKAHGGEI
ncbi:MAG: tetratricopeptide repeat protein, partial [Ferruginibacter sp.]